MSLRNFLEFLTHLLNFLISSLIFVGNVLYSLQEMAN